MPMPAGPGRRMGQGTTSMGERHLVHGATDQGADLARHRGSVGVDPVLLQEEYVCPEGGRLAGSVHWSAPGVDAPMDVVGRYCERIVHAVTLRPSRPASASAGTAVGGEEP